MQSHLALSSPQTDSFTLSESLWQEACAASRVNPRRRIILPLHRSTEDAVQRMLNVMQPGTYCAPHQHPAAGFSETICVLQGAIGYFEFDTTGRITRSHILRAGAFPFITDFIGPLWHTFLALEEDTVVLEIKMGPYLGKLDKVCAAWAPSEEDPTAVSYLQNLFDNLAVNSTPRT
jgi:cupin fold WbuC family metalloprotein